MALKHAKFVTILKETDNTVKTYVNLAAIRHSANDFIMDFCFSEPLAKEEMEEIQKSGERILPIGVRLIASPSFLPDLIGALKTQWDKYCEEQKKS